MLHGKSLDAASLAASAQYKGGRMPKGFSLMRFRRVIQTRKENWFTVNRFRNMQGELLTPPTDKFLEKQERLRTLEELEEGEKTL